MFDRIAPTYDLANRMMSFGMDQVWRRRAIAALGEAGQGRVVDLCAGTLDLSSQLARRGVEHVAAVDFSEGMLQAGKAKLPPDAPVELVVADARDLPLQDGSYDALISGFGLRNVTELERVLAECARVVRPGGVMVVLEAFQPQRTLSRLMHGGYNRVVMPILGGLISGDRASYRYLPKSMEAFVSRERFQELLDQAGFEVSGHDMFPPLAGMVVGTRRP